MLKDLRKEIDELDDIIIRALNARFLTVEKIAKIKKIENINITDSTREIEVIERVKKNSKDEYKDHIISIYKTILKESKEYQKK